jgi:hypothetical protein
MSTSIESPGEPQAIGPTESTLCPEASARRLFRLDMILLALVLILAFFLGSFTASNTEVFLHLSLANPFADYPPGGQWVHHAWLPSLLLGLIYEPFSPGAVTGGAIAVALKALVVVAVALVLCLIRRRGQSWIWPVAITGLCMVVMSRRVNLDPSVFSLLFLALTLWVLTLPRTSHPRAIYWLPPLFLLWVNTDQWFVLGPLTVLLWLIGEVLQFSTKTLNPGPDADAPRIKQLAAVLGIGLLACLINPWTYRAFTLPMELGLLLSEVLPARMAGAGGALHKIREAESLPQFYTPFSPLSGEYWAPRAAGKYAAGMAYFGLLGLSLASFVALAFFLPPAPDGETKPRNRLRIAIPLLLIYLVFAGLSLYSNRFVHFFAVVAGPVAALNWLDFLRLRRIDPSAWTKAEMNRALGGRLAALAAGLAAVACAWPGWLHNGFDYNWRNTRHVAWGVFEDPGIEDAAKTIAKIQEQTGLLNVGFNFSVEGGNLFDWSVFHDKSGIQLFCDTRFDLPLASATDYGEIHKSLREDAELQLAGSPQDRFAFEQWREKIVKLRGTYQALLEKHNIGYVVLNRLPQDSTSARVAFFLQRDQGQWALLYHDGRTAVFGWNGKVGSRGTGLLPYRLNLERIPPSATFPPNLPQVAFAGDTVPAPPMDVSTDWGLYLFGPVRPALQTFQATQFIAMFDSQKNVRLNGAIDALVGCAGGPMASEVWKKDRLLMPVKDQEGKVVGTFPLFRPRDVGPPAAPLLAIRAARAAVLVQPDDDEAYCRIAEATKLLMEAQEDYWMNRPNLTAIWFNEAYKPPLRRQFRTAQIVAALREAVTIRPDNWEYQYFLSQIFFDLKYYDLGLDHLLLAKAGLDGRIFATKDDAEKAKPVKDKIDREAKTIAEFMKKSMEDYKQKADTEPELGVKFLLAIQDPTKQQKDQLGRDQLLPRGLIKEGMKLLNEVKFDKLKNEQQKFLFFVSWRLHLLLSTGQAREAYAWLQAEKTGLSKLLGGGTYEQYRAMAAAALGDYREAIKNLRLAETQVALPTDEQLIETQNQKLQHLATLGAALISGLPGKDGLAGALARWGDGLIRWMDDTKELGLQGVERRYVADLRLIRGLMAVEIGDTKAAAKDFEGSLRIVPMIADFPDRFLARRYLELLEAKE